MIEVIEAKIVSLKREIVLEKINDNKIALYEKIDRLEEWKKRLIPNLRLVTEPQGETHANT